MKGMEEGNKKRTEGSGEGRRKQGRKGGVKEGMMEGMQEEFKYKNAWLLWNCLKPKYKDRSYTLLYLVA